MRASKLNNGFASEDGYMWSWNFRVLYAWRSTRMSSIVFSIPTSACSAIM